MTRCARHDGIGRVDAWAAHRRWRMQGDEAVDERRSVDARQAHDTVMEQHACSDCSVLRISGVLWGGQRVVNGPRARSLTEDMVLEVR